MFPTDRGKRHPLGAPFQPTLWFHTCLSDSQPTPSAGVNIKIPRENGSGSSGAVLGVLLHGAVALHGAGNAAPLITKTAETPLTKCKVDILTPCVPND